MASVVHPDRRRSLAAVLAGIVALAVVLAAVLVAGHHTTAARGDDDQTVTGTVGTPALTSEGDSVTVGLPHGSVLATVTGPTVPGAGLPFQQAATTCTWTLTFTDATAAVPLSLADFDTIDHGGVVYHPYVVPGTPVPPTMLQPGHRVSFELRAVMVVGEGLLRYAPDGDHIEAKWDFEVETD